MNSSAESKEEADVTMSIEAFEFMCEAVCDLSFCDLYKQHSIAECPRVDCWRKVIAVDENGGRIIPFGIMKCVFCKEERAPHSILWRRVVCMLCRKHKK